MYWSFEILQFLFPFSRQIFSRQYTSSESAKNTYDIHSYWDDALDASNGYYFILMIIMIGGYGGEN